jgi:RNA-binding protein
VSAIKGKQRRYLRALGQRLTPSLHVGHEGVTDGVVRQAETLLEAHELIKVRVAGDDRAAREAILRRICDELQAAAVQHIGKVLVIYRQKTEKPKPKPSKPRRKPVRQLKRNFQNRP